MKISCQQIESEKDNLTINFESEKIENIILMEKTKEAEDLGKSLKRNLHDKKDEFIEKKFITPFLENNKSLKNLQRRLFIIAPSGIYDYMDWKVYLNENFYENYLIVNEEDLKKLQISIFEVIFPKGLIPINWPEEYDFNIKEFSPPESPGFCLKMKYPDEYTLFDKNLKINLGILSLEEFSSNIEIKININGTIYEVTALDAFKIKPDYKEFGNESKNAFLDLEKKWKKKDKIICPYCGRENCETIFFCECKEDLFFWKRIIFKEILESDQWNFNFFIFIKKEDGTVEWFAKNQKILPVSNTSVALKEGDSLYIISKNGTEKLDGNLGLYKVSSDIYILEAPEKSE